MSDELVLRERRGAVEILTINRPKALNALNGDVLRTEGIAEYTGIDSSTPYSLNGGELIIYARPRAPLAAAQ